MGHIRMMSAVQPFLSGAISKTVNMPEGATLDDIVQTYIEAWRLGIKAIAIYRDGSKRTQPLNTSKQKSETAPPQSGEKQQKQKPTPGRPYRRKLDNERRAITHKFSVGNHEGYLTVGLYEDGAPGEIFLTMAKEGSTVSGLMDCFATAISLALQYGVPLKVLCDKFSHTRFEPSGWTNNPDIRYAKSIMDYIFRWLATKFLPGEAQPQEFPDAHSAPIGGAAAAPGHTTKKDHDAGPRPSFTDQLITADAPSCADCGALMVRNGSCYKCLNCGSTSGCS
jgi:ribonucleoside-diphosphate reductase alpha chain